MSRKRAGKAESPGRAERPEQAAPVGRLELPEAGLAGEILAALGAGQAPAAPAMPGDVGDAGDAGPAAGRDRIFRFVDTLESRAAEEQRAVERPESWVTFDLAGEVYALPVARVQEILRITAITRVPHAPAPVRGITNLRGRVLAVVDLRLRLGLPAAEVDPRSRILVVDSRDRAIGLLVDGARQVVKLLPSAIVPPPADVTTERTDFIRGVCHLGEELVIALDVDRVLLVHDDPGVFPGSE
jgi:purine-binding chemotaxis protein CheW